MYRGARRGWLQIGDALPVGGEERVYQDDGSDAVLKLLGYAGDDHAAIGVPDKHDVAELKPFDGVDDVEDVGLQVHVARQKVRSLAQSRQRRHHNGVTVSKQPVRQACPTPSAVPSAMYQNEMCQLRTFPVR